MLQSTAIIAADCGVDIVHDPLPQLARTRRFEAAGFRAWPASSVSYDGTWLVRLTAGHPAKRLNSVSPLDPGDIAAFEERVARAERRFAACGRPPIFRLSPLAGPAISSYLDKMGWRRFSESLVMWLDLENTAFDDALHQIPSQDIGRFVEAALQVNALDPALRAGLSQVIGSIEPDAGLFVVERDDEPVATAICVHDGDLAGLFEVATCRAERGNGHGRRTVVSALKWARLRGAREAWLQVEADNETALGLYRSIGFREIYRYHYRSPPGA
jgi:ribosomal protein S18 acetylase RimI-like enzyme